MLFLGPEWSICPEQIFLSTKHCYYFHLSIGPFHCANFKKILPVDPELCGCANFDPKMAHFPKYDFFNEPCVFHSWLPACQKSKPDINL